MMGMMRQGTVNGIGEGTAGEILTSEGDGRAEDKEKPDCLKV